jgi:hypothetical protein
MKKYLVILGALLMVAGSAFAQAPSTLANQDSCDIAVAPAATLLLPYFSVDPSGAGETTLVTITNVSDVPAVAHFTVWSNLSYPVLDFNVYLTGYDVQGISLTDVLVNGTIPDTGTPTSISPTGSRSLNNATGNVNAAGGTFAPTCGFSQGGDGIIPPGLLSDIQSGLQGGSYGGCSSIALDTDTLVGYITIDVVNNCSTSLPVDAGYFTTEILFDNQLIGDYIRFDGAAGVAGASPLVHIKALPHGGPAGSFATGLTRTFYQRYQTHVGVADRRQPLPAQFAARYIDEDGGSFDTNFTIWREGVTDEAGSLTCASGALGDNESQYVEMVRFDERENPRTLAPNVCPVSPCTVTQYLLPETSRLNIGNTVYVPQDPSSDAGGWLYMNMSIPDTATGGNPYGIASGIATHNWVQVQMTAAGLFGVDFDAAYLNNGCSAIQGVTVTTTTGLPKIGPYHD